MFMPDRGLIYINMQHDEVYVIHDDNVEASRREFSWVGDMSRIVQSWTIVVRGTGVDGTALSSMQTVAWV